MCLHGMVFAAMSAAVAQLLLPLLLQILLLLLLSLTTRVALDGCVTVQCFYRSCSAYLCSFLFCCRLHSPSYFCFCLSNCHYGSAVIVRVCAVAVLENHNAVDCIQYLSVAR